jgi:hypothetical protein
MGAGFGAGFLFLFAVIPFFLRAGAPRFACLDFFATFKLPNGSIKFMPTGTTLQRVEAGSLKLKTGE